MIVERTEVFLPSTINFYKQGRESIQWTIRRLLYGAPIDILKIEEHLNWERFDYEFPRREIHVTFTMDIPSEVH